MEQQKPDLEPIEGGEIEPKKFGYSEIIPLPSLPKLIKGIGEEKKRVGRQRDEEEVEELFYWTFRTLCKARNWTVRAPYSIKDWPYGLSEDMRWYYTKEYVRSNGKAHGKYIEYWRKFGEKFGYSEKTTEKNHSVGPGNVTHLSERKNALR